MFDVAEPSLQPMMRCTTFDKSKAHLQLLQHFLPTVKLMPLDGQGRFAAVAHLSGLRVAVLQALLNDVGGKLVLAQAYHLP